MVAYLCVLSENEDYFEPVDMFSEIQGFSLQGSKIQV